MKIGIMSDLHLDINDRGQKHIVRALSEMIKIHNAKLMLIAGDLANNYETVLNALQEIQDLSGVPVLFVPGNHDIWNVRHPEKTSWEIYQALQTFSGNLCRGPYEINDNWVVIGEMGWYDYTFGNHGIFSMENFDQMEYNEMLWLDKIFACWQRSVQDVSLYFYTRLEEQLKKYQGKNVITLTHIIPHVEFTVKYYPETWDYFNAYLGSSKYGNLFLDYEVKYAIFGHVHFRKQKRIANTTFICNSLGYSKEWRNLDPYLEIARTFQTIEI